MSQRLIIDNFIATDERGGIYTVLVVEDAHSAGSSINDINFELEQGEQLADLGNEEFGIIFNGVRIRRIKPNDADETLYLEYVNR